MATAEAEDEAVIRAGMIGPAVTCGIKLSPSSVTYGNGLCSLCDPKERTLSILFSAGRDRPLAARSLAITGD